MSSVTRSPSYYKTSGGLLRRLIIVLGIPGYPHQWYLAQAVWHAKYHLRDMALVSKIELLLTPKVT